MIFMIVIVLKCSWGNVRLHERLSFAQQDAVIAIQISSLAE